MWANYPNVLTRVGCCKTQERQCQQRAHVEQMCTLDTAGGSLPLLLGPSNPEAPRVHWASNWTEDG